MVYPQQVVFGCRMFVVLISVCFKDRDEAVGWPQRCPSRPRTVQRTLRLPGAVRHRFPMKRFGFPPAQVLDAGDSRSGAQGWNGTLWALSLLPAVQGKGASCAGRRTPRPAGEAIPSL
ncbi:Hypothetical predicted protein [Marmota monax]|uniref:Uncharacterized protein n=1 Tax=Marmota monax TaxID=9995 RepID=A0A5E4AAY9_MARMO|nr:Hypothetical predicted protein [Marmota monax]